MEIWKDIRGYERYQVSNKGRIRSKERVFIDSIGRHMIKREKVLKLLPSYNRANNIYYRVFLYDNRQNSKPFLVHRLVAKMFLDKIEGKDFVNHKDGNPENNNSTNLEWCTRSENQIHAILTGLHPVGVRSTRSKLKQKDIDFIRNNHEIRSKTLSVNEIKTKYNIAPTTYNNIINNKTYKD